MDIKRFLLVLFFAISLFITVIVYAATDTDQDGLDDNFEIAVFYTDPESIDTDKDGYPDKLEIDNGYSPHRAEYRLSQLDWDKDGLSDEMEIKFGTDLKSPDTDGDGFSDKTEIDSGFDPLNSQPAKLSKKIEINLSRQELSYFLSDVKLGTFKVSSGMKNWETPAGNFQIYNKYPKAWSRLAGLWMPYWMAFHPTGKFGIHELPYWPSGVREGADHLGTPVSHGCVRLGIGSAEFLYNWAEIGTPVIIR